MAALVEKNADFFKLSPLLPVISFVNQSFFVSLCCPPHHLYTRVCLCVGVGSGSNNGRFAEVNNVDAVNLMVHVFNSLIMLIDLAIVGHPIKLTHAYWTMGIGVAYTIFSAIYYLAGGTDR